MAFIFYLYYNYIVSAFSNTMKHHSINHPSNKHYLPNMQPLTQQPPNHLASNLQLPKIQNNQLYYHHQTGKKIKNYVYNYNELIGRGNFAKVYRGLNTITQQIIAIKMISLDELKSKRLQQLVFQQIKILQQMNHPNVLKFYQALLSDRNCYIVTQLCGEGNLEELIKKNKHLSDHELARLILDIYQGLKYLRQMNVTHRDLKTANIFLHNGTAKIADFGLAKFYKQKFQDLDIGSPLYMSPQGLIYNVYGEKTDIWAFGIIIYELLHGKTPFCDCESESDLKGAICKPIPQSRFRKDINPMLRHLMNSLLQINDKNRPNIFQLINQPYLKNIINPSILKSINPFDYHSSNKKILIDVKSKNICTLDNNNSAEKTINSMQKINQIKNIEVIEDKHHEPNKFNFRQTQLHSINDQTYECKSLKSNQFKILQIPNAQLGNQPQKLACKGRSQTGFQNNMVKLNNQAYNLQLRREQNNYPIDWRSQTHRQYCQQMNKSSPLMLNPPKVIIFNENTGETYMRRQPSDKTIQTKQSNQQKPYLQNTVLVRPKSVYFI